MAEAIKAILENLISRLEKDKVGLLLPQELLKKVLTKKELGHIKINYFRKGILSINVDSSVLLYQLSLQKKRILAALGSESVQIKDIRFRIGEIK